MKEYNEQVVETLDDAGCIIANKNIIIDNLQVRIAELEAENARLKAECDDIKQVQFPRKLEAVAAGWKKRLAAEQLNNKLLRDALDKTRGALAYVKANGRDNPNLMESTAWHGLAAADKALATPISTEALDAYVAEKVKEAGKFDMWKINPYTKVLETSIKQLTKQRGLAVEALKERLEYAGIIEERCDSIATDKARAAIKESEK